MKKSLLLIIALFAGVAVFAQGYYQIPVNAGNPGGLNTDDEYPVGGGLSSTWTTILGGSNSTPTWSPNQTIPFTFEFNGVTESSYKVSSTGILTFNTSAAAAPSSTPNTIPNAAIPDKSILVWGIEGIGSNDNIVTKTFGTAPNRQHWIFFSSYGMNGVSGGWSYWSIVLEESTNNIYIVDQRNANGSLSATVGVQVDGSTAVSVAGSPNVTHLAGNGETAADNFYYSFLPGTQPTYDMAGLNFIITPFLSLTDAPFDIEAEFSNYGTATITSADMNYSINGGAAVTQALTGLNIASGQTVTLTHPTPWNPSATGAYDVEVWLSNINGNADEMPGNDRLMENVTVVAAATERFSLYETFTSSTCPPCTPANATMEQIFANNPGGHVSIKYQMDWPGSGDPYYTEEGGTRRAFYSVTSVPNVAIDGGWNDNGNSLTQGIYDQFKQVPAFVEIDVTHSIFSKTVDAEISIDPLADINSNNLRVFVAIIEKETFQNAKTNGETEFFNVFKKFMTSDNGDVLSPLTAGTPVNLNYSYTFNGNYVLPPSGQSPVNHSMAHTVEEFSDLAVVVWIQDIVTKEVFQAGLSETPVIGVEELSTEKLNLKMYPNPTGDVAFLSLEVQESTLVQVCITNALGQEVVSLTEQMDAGSNVIDLQTSGLDKGIYFVETEIDGMVNTMKLMVQ